MKDKKRKNMNLRRIKNAILGAILVLLIASACMAGIDVQAYSDTKEKTSFTAEELYVTDMSLSDALKKLESIGVDKGRVVCLTADGENYIQNTNNMTVVYQEVKDNKLYLYCMFNVPGVMNNSLPTAINQLKKVGYKASQIKYVSIDSKNKSIQVKSGWVVVNVAVKDKKVYLYCLPNGKSLVSNLLTAANSVLSSDAGTLIEAAVILTGDPKVVDQINEYVKYYDYFKTMKEKFNSKNLSGAEWLEVVTKAKKVYNSIEALDTSKWSVAEKAYLSKIEIAILNDIING